MPITPQLMHCQHVNQITSEVLLKRKKEFFFLFVYKMFQNQIC